MLDLMETLAEIAQRACHIHVESERMRLMGDFELRGQIKWQLRIVWCCCCWTWWSGWWPTIASRICFLLTGELIGWLTAVHHLGLRELQIILEWTSD
jgi:hypothetical protein